MDKAILCKVTEAHAQKVKCLTWKVFLREQLVCQLNSVSVLYFASAEASGMKLRCNPWIFLNSKQG